jgi:hypothetical protein
VTTLLQDLRYGLRTLRKFVLAASKERLVSWNKNLEWVDCSECIALTFSAL